MDDNEIANQIINEGLQFIVPKLLIEYQNLMESFLIKVMGEKKPFSDAHVVILIMNVSLKLMRHVFFSLHEFLPTTILDYKFLIVNMLNNLKRELPQIVDAPRPFEINLTVDQIDTLKEKGELLVTASDGSEHLITEKDLLSSPVIIYQDIAKAKKEKNKKLKSDIIQLIN